MSLLERVLGLRWWAEFYSPQQPRVPAGSAAGGQFAPAGGSVGGAQAVRMPPYAPRLFAPKFWAEVQAGAIESANNGGRVTARRVGTVGDALSPEARGKLAKGVEDVDVWFASNINGRHNSGYAVGEMGGKQVLVLNPEQAGADYVPGFLHELRHLRDRAAGKSVTATGGMSYAEAARVASERRAIAAEKKDAAYWGGLVSTSAQ